MDNVLHILPNSWTPDLYEVEWWLNIPPFSTGIARGEGWVTLYVELPFMDGVTRRVQFCISKDREIGGYNIQTLLMDASLLECWLINKLPPTVGRFTIYPLMIGSKI